MRILASVVTLLIAVAGILYAGDSAAEASKSSDSQIDPFTCLMAQDKVWKDCFPATDVMASAATADVELKSGNVFIKALGILTPNPYGSMTATSNGAMVGGVIFGDTLKFAN
jgi:hypothetical protein